MEDECANPQLLGWVKEWLDVAREQNSKGITTYRRAYDALKACPLTFQHPSELQQLKGFGPKLCERLADKLRKHCQQNGLPMPEPPSKTSKKQRRGDKNADEDDSAPESAVTRPKKRRQPKAYVPTLRSGPYALILALATLRRDDAVGLAKAEVVELAQPHCDASFSAPSDPTKFYTAWNSMKTLVSKEMVYERGRPLRRYVLTDEGWEVAGRLQRASDASSSTGIASRIPPLSEAQSAIRGTAATADTAAAAAAGAVRDAMADTTGRPQPATKADLMPKFTPIRLPPGSFTVHLLLDVREIRAKTDRDYMRQELSKQGVEATTRNLCVGDAQWVARCHDPALLARLGGADDEAATGELREQAGEVALDWIVERKRLDDLIGSLKDGRFHEQKFRLRRSGAARVVYVVEDMSMDEAAYARYDDAVRSAVATTQVASGYFVKRTVGIDDTIRYLVRLTRLLRDRYERRALNVIPSAVLTADNYLPLLEHLRGGGGGGSGSGIDDDDDDDDDVTAYHVSYSAFASLASKSETMTLKDVFLKMLMTTRGVTAERALEIQRRWRTPRALVEAYRRCGTGEAGSKRRADMVFAELSHLVGNKKFSKGLSQSIAEIWGAYDYKQLN